MTFDEKLAYLIEKSGSKREQIAEKIGVHPETLARYIRGERTPTIDMLPKLALALNTTVGYLTGELNEPFVLENNSSSAPPSPAFDKVIFVPVVSSKIVTACCGNGTPYATDVQWEIEDYFPVPALELIGYSWQGAQYTVMTAEGNSMEPFVKNGDKVLFAEGIDLSLGDIGVFSLNNRLLIRGLIKKNGVYVLRAHNWKEYPDLEIDVKSGDFCVIGRVLKVVSARDIPPVI